MHALPGGARLILTLGAEAADHGALDGTGQASLELAEAADLRRIGGVLLFGRRADGLLFD